MYFNKIPHPYNFIPWEQAEGLKQAVIKDLGENVFHITIGDDARWPGPRYESLIREDGFSFSGVSDCSVTISETGSLAVGRGEEPLLAPHHALPFGVLKDSWLWCFSLEDSMRFYGMGEKNIGFEKSGLRTKFWNTDVWADFADEEIRDGVTDPMYASFPVLIIRNRESWAALLIPTASPVFMDTGARQVIEGVSDTGADDHFFYLGAAGTVPEMYLIVDGDPISLVSKIQRLCGVTPRPPLWALGYHQSRWGYSTCDHLHELDRKFRECGIPCDGLWIDIDYMNGYRVFSLNEQVSPGLEGHLKRLKANGRRVVPILDPGVKVDPEYMPCTDGLDKNIFCQTAEGVSFVGFVWPGPAYFPDFSKEEARTWWAAKTAELARKGFEGFWIDMNDPSTGSVDLDDMLFRDGSLPHAAYHNAYGMGMAEATADGLKLANPGKRPFVLTRSSTLGGSRFGAMWTGDNISNYHHLRKGIEMVLSLSISGMPFVGSDVGGFGGNASKENYIDWYKANYLMPFMRNHSADGTREQEPWTFDEEVRHIVRTCVRARYALLPYLYQQFIRQEREGVPIVRPMIFQFPDDLRFEGDASQFMIGDDLMQAPNLREESHGKSRTILIPEGRWFDLYDGTWIKGPCEHTITEAGDALHLFARGGAVIPLVTELEGIDSTGDIDLRQAGFLVIADTGTLTVNYTYHYDDGLSFAYREGEESVVTLRYRMEGTGLTVDCSDPEAHIMCVGDIAGMTVNGKRAEVKEGRVPLPGMGCSVFIPG